MKDAETVLREITLHVPPATWVRDCFVGEGAEGAE